MASVTHYSADTAGWVSDILYSGEQESMLGNFKDIIARLEAQKAAIDKAIATLREFDEGGVSASATKKATAKKAIKKRVMSEASRKAISDAVKKRWAEKRKAAKKTA
jgi:hypothetical protein